MVVEVSTEDIPLVIIAQLKSTYQENHSQKNAKNIYLNLLFYFSLELMVELELVFTQSL